MRRTMFIAIIGMAVVVTMFLSCTNKGSNIKSEAQEERMDAISKSDACAELKKKMEKGEMKTYIDTTYNVAVPYPDFFEVATLEPGTARFFYRVGDEKAVAIVMFVEPNIEGWNIQEAAVNLSDSANFCIGVGENFFLMSSTKYVDPDHPFFEKCFLIDGNWIDYAVYFQSDYLDAIYPLLYTLLDWKPQP